MQFCLVKRALEQSRSFSLCWKPPHKAEPQQEACRDISITGTVLPCASRNICELVIRAFFWGMRNLESNPRSVGDLYVLLPKADIPQTLLGRSSMHLSPPKRQRSTRVLSRIWNSFQKWFRYLGTTGVKQLRQKVLSL